MTREFTRLTQRFGGVLAVAAVVAFVGGTVSIAANDRDSKDSKKEDKRKDDDYKERYKKKVWRKIWMCHVEKGGKAHLIEISEEALGSHRGHGDGEPGEQVARHRHHRWTRDCREAPEPPAPPKPPAPPTPPPPPPDATLSCPCWNGMKQSALAGLLGPDSSPATPQCVVNSTTVSLSQDEGINTLVYAASFGQCIQRVGGVDVGSNFLLSGDESAACMSEAAGIVPLVKWCPQ
jgi:hypothetical protein